jgi:DNA-binding IclR family transcriptional regulator
MTAATEAYFVTRTMRILEALATGPRSAPELAELIAVHPRTVRRILARLAYEDYVTRLPGPRRLHRLTMRLPALGAHALVNADVPAIGGPVAEQLHAGAGLAAHLVVPSYDCVVCIVPTRSGYEDGGKLSGRLRARDQALDSSGVGWA